jgi:hypothetical protein
MKGVEFLIDEGGKKKAVLKRQLNGEQGQEVSRKARKVRRGNRKENQRRYLTQSSQGSQRKPFFVF